MRESEAAQFLGVTPRTLYRYRRSGKLPYAQIPGKTCPVIEYAEADLLTLKAAIEGRKTAAQKAVSSPKRLPRVNFSLPNSELKTLEAEASQYGMTPGEYARRLVREGLESHFREEAEELRLRVSEVENETLRLRREFADGIEAILDFIGSQVSLGMSRDEAKEWVDKNLR